MTHREIAEKYARKWIRAATYNRVPLPDLIEQAINEAVPAGVVTLVMVERAMLDHIGCAVGASEIADALNAALSGVRVMETGNTITSVQQGLIDAAVAYIDQLSSFNRIDHPEVQKQRMCLSEMVNAYHNERYFSEMNGEKADVAQEVEE